MGRYDYLTGDSASQGPDLFSSLPGGSRYDYLLGEGTPESEEPGFLGSALHAVTRPFAAAQAGVSTLANLARGTLEGDPLAHFKLTPEAYQGGVGGDLAAAVGLADPRLEQTSAIDLAQAGISQLPALATGEYDVRRPVESYLPGRGPGDTEAIRQAFAAENPVMAGAEAIADPLAKLGLQFGTDPTLAGMGKLASLAARGVRGAGAAERALGATFVPGMVESAAEAGNRYLQAGRERGYLSPEALGAGTEALTSGVLAGFGAKHALLGGRVAPQERPGTVPRQEIEREALREPLPPEPLQGATAPEVWEGRPPAGFEPPRYEGVLPGETPPAISLPEPAPVTLPRIGPPVPDLAEATMLVESGRLKAEPSDVLERRLDFYSQRGWDTAADAVRGELTARAPEEQLPPGAGASVDVPVLEAAQTPGVVPVPVPSAEAPVTLVEGRHTSLQRPTDLSVRIRAEEAAVGPDSGAADRIGVNWDAGTPQQIAEATKYAKDLREAWFQRAKDAGYTIKTETSPDGIVLFRAYGPNGKPIGRAATTRRVDGAWWEAARDLDRGAKQLTESLSLGETRPPRAPDGVTLPLEPVGAAPESLPERAPERRQEVAAVPVDRRLAERRAAVAQELQLPEEHPAVERTALAEHEARTDPLTGLGNKRAWEELQKTVAPEDHTLVMDLKRFKPINDTYGHEAGDLVLKATSEVLTEHLGPDAARFGGDEFGGIFRGLSLEEAQAKGRLIQDALSSKTVRVRMPDGSEVDIPGIQSHIGVGKDAREADLAANAAAAESRKTGRGALPADIGAEPGVAGGPEVRGPDRTVSAEPIPAPEPAQEVAPSEPPSEPKYSAKPNRLGFFSQLRRAIDDTKQPAASGQNWAAYLRDQKRGVKAEELKWTGLDDYLKERSGQKVTKQEIQEFLDQNEVQVEEVTLGERGSESARKIQEQIDRLDADIDNSPVERRDLLTRRDRLAKKLEAQSEAPKPTKFSQYQLPGGESYRELLLKLPEVKKARQTYLDFKARMARQYGQNWTEDRLTKPEIAEWDKLRVGASEEGGGDIFRGGHFDEPNILAHIRFNERTDAQGKRVLFIEEVQSDWAQKGRREGFGSGFDLQEKGTGNPLREDLQPFKTREEAEAWAERRFGPAWRKLSVEIVPSQKIPAAPFVGKTEAWSELALKRMVRWGAENGFDKVAWTRGEQQAARYDLSKHVDSVEWTPWPAAGKDHGILVARKGGEEVIKQTIPQSALPDHIGKDVAERLLQQPSDAGGRSTLSGEGLSIGGRGMLGFYDQILPAVAGKIGKKWGAKVGETEIPGGKIEPAEMSHAEWVEAGRPNRAEAGAPRRSRETPSVLVHALDITPEMRRSVTEEGFPQFRATEQKAGPRVTTDTVRQAFAAGGVKEAGEGAWDVKLPAGNVIRVRVRPDGVEFNREAFEKGYSRQKAESEQIVGAWQKIGADGAVWLAKEADTGTVHHEAFHAAMDLALGAKEKAAVLKRYGSEEAAAEAYAKWNPAKTTNSWFSRILAVAKRLYRSFRPSWESAFERTRSGEAYGKPTAEAPTETKYATAPKAPPQIPPQKTGPKPVPPAQQPAPPQAQPAVKFSIPEETRLQKVQRLVQDKLNRVSTVQEAIRKQGGVVREDIKSLMDAFTPKAAERVTQVDQEYVSPLVKGLASENLKLEDLDQYLYAKHAPTRNKVIADRTEGSVLDGSGMSDAEAARVLGDFQTKGLTPKLDNLAKIVRDMRDKQVEVLLDGGLISKAQAKGWRDTMGDDYVPLRTAEIEEGIGTGQGFDVRGKEAKAATGRKSEADSPATAMVQQLQRAIVRAEKNKIDQAFAELVKANPDKSLWEMDASHTKREIGPDGKVREVGDPLAAAEDFHYKVNGETKRVTIKDPLLDRAVKNLSAKETGKLVETVGQFTRLYSQMVTSWNPEFLATNFTRDIQSALGNVSVEQGGKVAAAMVKNIPKAMKGMYQSLRDPKSTDPMAKMAREFREDGGSVGWFSIRDLPQLEKSLTGKVKRAGPGAANAGLRALGGFKDWVENANKTVEGGTRFALYKALRDSGTDRAKAAGIARNVTIDFNKKGELGPGVNALYAFFNANIQGGKRLYDVLKTPKGKVMAAGIMTAGWALDQYNRASAGDANNDGTNDYDDIPEYVKERNLVIMRGSGKNPLLIPMPYGFNVIHTAGRQVSATLSGATTPIKAASAIGSSLANAFNPLGSESDIVQILSPTFLDPVVQDVMNKDFTGRSLRPEGFPGAAEKPDAEKYFRNVNPVARELARFLNEKTGGDKVTPGYISVSPETMEHYFSFVTGGLGKFAKNVEATGAALVKGETPELRSLPFARRFAYEASPGLTGQKYNEAMQQVENLKKRVKTYREERKFDRLKTIPMRWVRATQELDRIDSAVRRLKRSGGPRADQEIERLKARANRLYAETSRAAGAP